MCRPGVVRSAAPSSVRAGAGVEVGPSGVGAPEVGDDVLALHVVGRRVGRGDGDGGGHRVGSRAEEGPVAEPAGGVEGPHLLRRCRDQAGHGLRDRLAVRVVRLRPADEGVAVGQTLLAAGEGDVPVGGDELPHERGGVRLLVEVVLGDPRLRARDPCAARVLRVGAHVGALRPDRPRGIGARAVVEEHQVAVREQARHVLRTVPAVRVVEEREVVALPTEPPDHVPGGVVGIVGTGDPHDLSEVAERRQDVAVREVLDGVDVGVVAETAVDVRLRGIDVVLAVPAEDGVAVGVDDLDHGVEVPVPVARRAVVAEQEGAAARQHLGVVEVGRGRNAVELVGPQGREVGVELVDLVAAARGLAGDLVAGRAQVHGLEVGPTALLEPAGHAVAVEDDLVRRRRDEVAERHEHVVGAGRRVRSERARGGQVGERRGEIDPALGRVAGAVVDDDADLVAGLQAGHRRVLPARDRPSVDAYDAAGVAGGRGHHDRAVVVRRRLDREPRHGGVVRRPGRDRADRGGHGHSMGGCVGAGCRGTGGQRHRHQQERDTESKASRPRGGGHEGHASQSEPFVGRTRARTVRSGPSCLVAGLRSGRR